MQVPILLSVFVLYGVVDFGIQRFVIFPSFLALERKEAITDVKISGVYQTRKGPMLISSRPILTSQNEGPVWGPVIMVKKLSDSRSRLMQRSRNAFHDTLTGLPNRAYLIERLQVCIDRCKRQEDYLFGLLFLDVVNFKLVNDSLGHERRDELLVEIATRLNECVGSIGMVSR